MKKFLILLLILMLPTVFADTELFSGKLYDNEPTEINGIQLAVSSGSRSSLIKYGSEEFLVIVNSCENYDDYKVCLHNVEETIFSEFTISRKEIEIKFEKTLDPDQGSFKLGQATTVKLLVSNLGSIPVDFIILDDVSNLTITNIASPCKLENDYIIFDSAASGNSAASCTYRVFFNKIIDDEEREAVLNYSEGNETKQLKADVSFEVHDESLSLNLIINDKKKYELYELFIAEIELKNTFAEPVTVKTLEITTEGLKIVDFPNKFRNPGQYLFAEEIELKPGETKKYEFTYNLTGFNGKLITNMNSFSPRGLKNNLQTKTIEANSVKPDIRLEKVSDTHFKIHIANQNTKYHFKNLDVKVQTNLQNINIEKNIEEIRLASDYVLDLYLEEMKTKPDVKYPLFITVDYEIGENQLSFSRTLEIDIRERIIPVDNQGVTNQSNLTLDGLPYSSKNKITLYVVLGLIVLAIIIGISIFLLRKRKLV